MTREHTNTTAQLLLEELREAEASDSGRGPLLRTWERAVDSGQLPPSLVADTALLLLETLTEADASLDMVASDLLRRHGDARHLERATEIRPNLRSRVALRDWRFEVDRAISTLRARAEDTCPCAAEAKHAVPPKIQGFAVENEEVDTAAYEVRLLVRCTNCGRGWRVVERHGYHYPTYSWTASGVAK